MAAFFPILDGRTGHHGIGFMLVVRSKPSIVNDQLVVAPDFCMILLSSCFKTIWMEWHMHIIYSQRH